MTDVLLIIVTIVCALNLIALIILLFKSGKNKGDAAVKELKLSAERDREISIINNQNLIATLDRSAKAQNEKFLDLERRVEDLTKTNELRLGEMNKKLDDSFRYFGERNEKQLGQMREVVEEKLASTLEKRLDGSYKIISDNLEAVSKGIGEVKKLAESVDDIKKVFSNTKVRGTWGETQLNMLLEEMLSKDQYVKNFRINPKVDSFVDFAIALPDREGNITYLPIDSKFPIEEFRRIVSMEESLEEREKSVKAFITVLKKEAVSIYDKYVLPPKTTDFAIMYLPIESLYAEALKSDELMSFLHKNRIMICGPTNLGALLNSLQTGFKTLAIEKRSSELWKLLAAFKTEFKKFGDLLDKTGKKLQEAQDNLDLAAKRTRMIDKKLKTVEVLEETEAEKLLGEEGEERDD